MLGTLLDRAGLPLTFILGNGHYYPDARSPRTANTGVTGAVEKHKTNMYKERVEAAGGEFPFELGTQQAGRDGA
jgi:hypothetical protein